MPMAMPSGLAFGSAMVLLFFFMLMSHELIFVIYSYVNNQLDGLFFFITYFVVKYANIFYLSCKDLSDRIRKFTPTVFFLCRNRYYSTDP